MMASPYIKVRTLGNILSTFDTKLSVLPYCKTRCHGFNCCSRILPEAAYNMNAKEDTSCFFLRKIREMNEKAEDKNWEKKGESLELNDIRRSPLLEKPEQLSILAIIKTTAKSKYSKFPAFIKTRMQGQRARLR